VTETDRTVLGSNLYGIIISNDTISIQTVVNDYYFKDDVLYLVGSPESDEPLSIFVKG
jgi:hypothetical protein